jgi:anthranilate phosphoribosyltransferase
MIRDVVNKLINYNHLSESEMIEIMEHIMAGKVSNTQIAAFLAVLRMKGETVEEITACAKVMREKSLHVRTKHDYTIDTCGTGGSESHIFNVSTASAFICAAAGTVVVKHGNRSISSKCGSADVLESLGVNIDLNEKEVGKCVDELGIGFMFAPNFHGAMKHVAVPRRELGIRTIFNVLGPLTNPAKVKGQIMGVFSEELTEVMAEVLKALGVKKALVVHGIGGLDEISLSSETKVTELNNGEITTYYIEPEMYGLDRAEIKHLVGGEKEENAAIIMDILSGHKGPKTDLVLLNAGAAIYVGNKADSIEEGIKIAKEVISSGLALEKLNQLISLSQEMKS